ncbi:AzlD domain-containing protein [Aliiruegeria sabulilitoris]|uniref:AzlD domain-containing protein n=1 Tax=Aliiruegeria sabulilitoris TaxID=1510458 RepID=UPI000831B10D|nr:AzlD domain-containing protein [Aliiruegeria sabulilitoris]NDR57588.1 AzlD domain-containing protein [Pseudoruegeria sp. M32A2M]
MISDATFWTLTILLGIGTYLIRFSFLGLLGRKTLPDWVLLHLKYVGVAVFPALVLPLIVWPEATGGVLDPLRVLAALATLFAGFRFGVVWAIVAGMGTLYLLQLFTNQI